MKLPTSYAVSWSPGYSSSAPEKVDYQEGSNQERVNIILFQPNRNSIPILSSSSFSHKENKSFARRMILSKLCFFISPRNFRLRITSRSSLTSPRNFSDASQVVAVRVAVASCKNRWIASKRSMPLQLLPLYRTPNCRRRGQRSHRRPDWSAIRGFLCAIDCWEPNL
jgi:hypothetical protein